MLEEDRRRELGAVMDEVAQYRKYANECHGWVATAKTPSTKTSYWKWLRLGKPSPDRKSQSLQKRPMNEPRYFFIVRAAMTMLD
jgi:hypothetical protein